MKPLHLTGTPEHINVAVNALGRIALDPRGPNSRQQTAFNALQEWMTDISDAGPKERTVHLALASLLGVAPDDVRDNFGAFMGPLLVWSSQQSWAYQVQTPRVFSALCHRHLQSRLPRDDIAVHTAALSHCLLWGEHLPARWHLELATYVILSTNGQLNWTWRRSSSPAQRVDEWNLLVLQTCLLARLPGAKEAHANWLEALSGYCTMGLNLDEQSRWAQWALSSPLPDTHKTAILSLLVPEVWLQDPIQTALQPLLPQDEVARFNDLPWAVVRSPTWTRVLSGRDHQEVNRDLVAKYCPFAFQFLHCMATPSQWSSRAAIQEMLVQIHAREHLEPLALPDNMEAA